MKKIELKDFLNYRFLNNIKVSPDQKSCIFGVAVSDEENNCYKNNVYMWKDGVCRPLTSSDKDTGAIYLDAETILFQSTRDKWVQERQKEGEEISVFYKISLNGGEAEKLFEIPLAVSQIELLDEQRFLLLATYNRDYSVAGREEQKEEILKAKKDSKDYEVFTKLPVCYNGKGYLLNETSRLYIYDQADNSLKAVSPDNVNVTFYGVKEDKSEISYAAETDMKQMSLLAGLYTYDVKTESTRVRIPQKDYTIDGVHYFDNRLFFIGNNSWEYGCNENGRFFFIDEENNITLFYDNIETLTNSVGSDCRYGSGCQAKVYGNKFYFLNTLYKDCILRSIDLNGKVKDEVVLNGAVDCFDVQGDTICYIAMKDGKLQEVYKQQNEEQLSFLNEKVHENRYVASYEEVPFENDGVDFTGWVLLPKDYDPNQKYPAILDIHGGPKTAYGTVFYHEMQLWANMGYFVFFTNPRGSDGRGNAFTDIFGKYGTIDYEDLMKFTDVVLEKYPAIDQSRVGVTGGSYGGFMTNWIIGHTDRFACAATQRSISNWLSFYGTSDIGMFFMEDQIRANIFDDPAKVWEQSPLKYARNIKTPTLFIHSDEDYRCPVEQGLQLYTAMVDRGVEAKFVLFHGENHELSRSGKPKHRVRRLEEITNWMERFLK